METELWPNLVREAGLAGVPLFLANARMSEKSAAGYQRFSAFAREVLQTFAAVAAQTEEDAMRLRGLGASNVTVTGNLTSDVTMAHIHGPASTSGTADIVLDFVPSMSSVISAGTRTGTIVNASFDLNSLTVSPTGVLRVTPEVLIGMLNSGQAYVNVHTETNPTGEIRGQITDD